jgi:hypothetical protein
MNEDPKVLRDLIDGYLTVHPKLILTAILINTLREDKELLDEFEIYCTYETLREKYNISISAKSFREWLCNLITCGLIKKVKQGCKIYFKLTFHPEIVKKAFMLDPQIRDLLLSELNEQNIIKIK